MAWLPTFAESLVRQPGSHNDDPEVQEDVSEAPTAPDDNIAGTDSEAWSDEDGRSESEDFSDDERLPDEEPELVAIYEAFDASQPVRDPGGLYGRSDQLQRLVSGVLYRRNHGVISGPRGSGKTSMVKVFGRRAEVEGVVVLYSANDADAPFGLMMRQLLEQIPPSSLEPGEWESFLARVQSLDEHSGAQQVINLLSRLAYSAVVIIIDEFDRVPDESFKAQTSSLLKLSSDARLRVRFLLVGDERTFPEVVRGHASLSRHTTHVTTGPLSDSATEALLDSCVRTAGMRISEPARRLLVDAAFGSPYHARLFGLHAGLRAYSDDLADIDVDHVLAGLNDAFDEWSSLNSEDSAVFRRLIQGGKDDRPLIAVAEELAWRRAPDPGATGDPLREDALEKLRPAVEGANGAATFRDATAAQFLIALHLGKSSRAARRLNRKKERAHS